MSKVGEWLETADGRIFEVEEETHTTYSGREILYKEPKPLRYGNIITINKADAIYEEEY